MVSLSGWKILEPGIELGVDIFVELRWQTCGYTRYQSRGWVHTCPAVPSVMYSVVYISIHRATGLKD